MKIPCKFAVVAVLLLGALGAFVPNLTTPCYAVDGTVAGKTTVTDVARELICTCPDCGKQSLDQCGHCAIGEKYRAVIGRQLQEGKSKGQILAYFANKYGDSMLGNPRPQGFNRSAVLMPAFAALLGLIPLGTFLRKRHKTTRALPMPSASPTPIEDPRITAALRDYDL